MGERIHTRLVEHGIQNELADIRAHVCVRAEVVYVFETAMARQMIAEGLCEETVARTNGAITSRGYKLPVRRAKGLIAKTIPPDILNKAAFTEKDSTSERGKKAQDVLIALIRRGWFPFKANAVVVSDVHMQRGGIDLMVNLDVKIQVKCDWDGGDDLYQGCSGNLYIEVAECNPHGSH